MECAECGKKLLRYPCQMVGTARPFCSQACLSEYRRHGSFLKCHRCGKGFYRRTGEQDIGVRVHQFCSRECYMTDRRDNMKVSVYPKSGQVHIHRITASAIMGRPLAPGEIVHHINNDKHDNSPANLFIFKSQEDHARYHAKKNKLGVKHGLR